VSESSTLAALVFIAWPVALFGIFKILFMYWDLVDANTVVVKSAKDKLN
jgi:hypothetical protein